MAVYFSDGRWACPVCGSTLIPVFDTFPPDGPMVWLHEWRSYPCLGIYQSAVPVPPEGLVLPGSAG